MSSQSALERNSVYQFKTVADEECSSNTRSVSPTSTLAVPPTINDKKEITISSEVMPNRRASLRKSFSFKKEGTNGLKKKSSLFASFRNKTSDNVLPAGFCRHVKTNLSPEAHHDTGTAYNNSDTEKELDFSQSSNSTTSAVAGRAAADDSQEEHDAFPSKHAEDEDNKLPPNEETFTVSSAACDIRVFAEEHSRAYVMPSFDEVDGVSIIKDSDIMLSRLGEDPSDEEMAEVASTRAQESIINCFSFKGDGFLDRCKYDAIPSYSKNELQICRFLGKGTFSDVFEVTVAMPDQVSGVPSSDELDVLLANAVSKMDSNNSESKSITLSNEGLSGIQRSALQQRRLSSSACTCSLGMPELRAIGIRQGKRLTLAMKCLRPQARKNFEQFLLGVEDLVTETAILSSLDHPNIIKLHGRSCDSSSFSLSDGYFILIDRLEDTLQDRINRWAKSFSNSSKNAPSINQIKVACDLSNAISYLHFNDIVFRDLKPANVGFDASGTLKLFDFGFATRTTTSSQEPLLLREVCGTLRYMAPEVALGDSYGKKVDVYSFAIVLWEICSLKKAFSSAKNENDFKNKVFVKGERPKLGMNWPEYLKETLQNCWSSDCNERPTMNHVKSMLTAAARELKTQPVQSTGASSLLKKSFVGTRRLTWNL